MNTEAIKTRIATEAYAAAQKYLDQHFAGQDAGACGFAWVTITPKHKGNTKLGKAERLIFRALGAELDYTGKTFQIWNPAGIGAQNIDCKEAGALVAARILTENGIDAHAASRLD